MAGLPALGHLQLEGIEQLTIALALDCRNGTCIEQLGKRHPLREDLYMKGYEYEHFKDIPTHPVLDSKQMIHEFCERYRIISQLSTVLFSQLDFVEMYKQQMGISQEIEVERCLFCKRASNQPTKHLMCSDCQRLLDQDSGQIQKELIDLKGGLSSTVNDLTSLFSLPETVPWGGIDLDSNEFLTLLELELLIGRALPCINKVKDRPKITGGFETKNDQHVALLVIVTTLKFIPEAVCRFPRLEKLMFVRAKSKLTALAEWAGDNNPDATQFVPECLQKLEFLSHLYLLGNALSVFPQNICLLENLQYLNLSDNFISELPPHIARLSQLKTLELNDNMIEDLPLSIGACKQLEHLDLRNNSLKRLPDTLRYVTTLKTLQIEGNPLKTIPEIILKHNKALLELVENRYQGVALAKKEREAIERLNTLLRRELQVIKDRSAGHIEIKDSHVTRLVLKGKFTDPEKPDSSIVLNLLPKEICLLERLESLTVTGLGIKDIPVEVKDLKHLKVLDLSNNELEQVPSGLFSLTSLEKLVLSGNSIKELTDHICELTKLQYLYLDNTEITRLPECMSQLPLRGLDLYGTRIDIVPQFLVNIESLSSLCLDPQFEDVIPGFLKDKLDYSRAVGKVFNRLAELFEDVTERLPINAPSSDIEREVAELFLAELEKYPLNKNILVRIAFMAEALNYHFLYDFVQSYSSIFLSRQKNLPKIRPIRGKNTCKLCSRKGDDQSPYGIHEECLFRQIELYKNDKFKEIAPEDIKFLIYFELLNNFEFKKNGLDKHLKIGTDQKITGLRFKSINKKLKIPVEVHKLSSLQVAIFSKLRGVVFPDTISVMPVLKRLVLTDVKLSDLPSWLTTARLECLEHLDLSDNRITQIPKGISNLSALKELILTSNKINTLSKDLSRCQKLIKLDLSNNQLSKLPKWIGQLKNLESLHLLGNTLTFVPDTISLLPKLRRLAIEVERQETLPKGLKQLPNLKVLELKLATESPAKVTLYTGSSLQTLLLTL